MAIKLPRKIKKALKKAVLSVNADSGFKTKEVTITDIVKNYHCKKLPSAGNISVIGVLVKSKTGRHSIYNRYVNSADAINVPDQPAQPQYSGSEIIEQICKPIAAAKKHEMDRDLTEILIMLYQKQSGPIIDSVPAAEVPFLFAVILKRIKYCHTFKCNDHRVIVFLAAVAESPGTAIMFLWYIQWWCFKNNVKEVDLELLGMKIFPDGFPSKEDLRTIWYAAKTDDGKNLVDINLAGSAIQFSA